jgi:peptidoglycan/xylan/chitin deacetylase (PgdA/CDA1 family)
MTNISRRAFLGGTVATGAFALAGQTVAQETNIPKDQLTRKETKALQEIVGTTPDGAWGPNSARSYRSFLNDNNAGNSFRKGNEVYFYNPDNPKYADLNVARFNDQGAQILVKHDILPWNVPGLEKGLADSPQKDKPQEKGTFDRAVEGVQEKAKDKAKETGDNMLNDGLNRVGDAIERGIGGLFK